MKIEESTCILPAFLASALINGDTSGIEDSPDDMATLERALAYLEGWHVTDCGEQYFAHRGACSIHWPWAGDVAEYKIYRTEE
jgi:hypothetical protein